MRTGVTDVVIDVAALGVLVLVTRPWSRWNNWKGTFIDEMDRLVETHPIGHPKGLPVECEDGCDEEPKPAPAPPLPRPNRRLSVQDRYKLLQDERTRKGAS